MENNNTIPEGLKAYVFAMYWGQSVLRIESHPDANHSVNYVTHSWADDKYIKASLQLNSLDTISDSEAIEVAKMLGYKGDSPTIQGWKKYIMSWFDGIVSPDKHGDCPIILYQYLIQQGFALSVYFKGTTYTVNQLQDLGIIKIIENGK